MTIVFFYFIHHQKLVKIYVIRIKNTIMDILKPLFYIYYIIEMRIKGG